MLKFNLKSQWQILLLLFLIIGLHFLGWLNPIENLITRTSAPVLARFFNYGLVSRKNDSNLDSAADLALKVQTLTQTINDLTVQNAKYQDLANENQRLREFLKFTPPAGYRQILGQSISQENFLDSPLSGQNIIINKGQVDGLIPGLAVLNSAGQVVGKILSVKNNSAEACLITNEACKLAVAILSSNQTLGVAEGSLGLTVKINFVGQANKVAVNDIIITSGLEPNIPRGLVLGRVNQATISQNDVWQNINLAPLADLNDLGIVSVILPNN